VSSIKLLLDKGMSVNLTKTDDCTRITVSAGSDTPEATKSFVERCAALNSAKYYGVTPLMVAETSCKM
jgi:hypothetical protein